MIGVRKNHIKEDQISAYENEIELLENQLSETKSIVKKMFIQDRIKRIEKKIESLKD